MEQEGRHATTRVVTTTITIIIIMIWLDPHASNAQL
jgi:hypothetical protein